MATLCLGEALVDLVCERRVADPSLADAFVPYFGGAVANAAVVAARNGARVSLAGGAGADAWGRWLANALARDGVGLDAFALIEDLATPVAFITTDLDGEPSFSVYGDGIPAAISSVEPRLEELVSGHDALFFGSNSLVGEPEREFTMRSRELALEAGKPVVFDPNLRLGRWRSEADARDASLACVPGALLVKCNAQEAALLTGRADPSEAAAALVAAGARMVVVTLGAHGALLRGAYAAQVPGVAADVVSTVGAGDVVAGVLLAHLDRSGFYEPAVLAGLGQAVEAGARATERWSAVG